MERTKLFEILVESLSPEQRERYLSNDIVESLQQETDERNILNEALQIVENYFSGQFNLVDYNIATSQELLQLCIVQRKELKDLEVLIVNQAAHRTTLLLKRQYETEIKNVENSFNYNQHKQLSRQTKVKIYSEEITADEQSQNEIKDFDNQIEIVNSTFKEKIEHVENQLIDLGIDESCGMNYLARYQQLKSVYKNRIIDLYKTLKNVFIGVSLIRKISHNEIGLIPKPRPNYFLYDCNNWLQKVISSINIKQSKMTYISKFTNISQFWPSALSNLRNFGSTELPGIFDLNEHVFLDTFSIIVKDSETDTKKDIWKIRFKLEVLNGALSANLIHPDNVVNVEEWDRMLSKEKNLEYYTETSNSINDISLFQINALNFKNIDPAGNLKLSIVSIGNSLNKKSTSSIEDLLIYTRGFTFK